MKHILGSNTRSFLTNVQSEDIQPNAVDLRIDKVYKILPTLFELSDSHKILRQTEEILPDENDYFNLIVGDYEIVMSNVINVGSGEAGWVITRSTLNRSNIFITSGLYDSGYGFDAKTGEKTGGVMAGCMHVGTGPAKIKRGTRVAQYLSFDAEALHMYDGSYGNHKDHDKKYLNKQ
jgi:deoxycytidine triphosphate deaminase